MRSAIVLLTALALSAAAQEHQHAMSPPPAPALDSGLGDLHVAVSTKNAEAQRYFDQGLRYVYAFNHEKAVESFKHAAELDPELGIASWGAALALGPNINMDVDPDREKQAYELAQAAAAHVANASAKERDLIAALTKRYSNDPDADLKKLAADYAAAMRALHAKYPDDPNVGALFAESLMDLHPWKFWTHDGEPTSPETTEIVSTLEGILKTHPEHVGANHYYIHAVEASLHPERALASAKRLTNATPAAGHLVHMPAHIYQRTGRYAEAAKANVAGAEADRAFMKQYGGENVYSMMYYNHNLDFGAASFAMEGRFDEAMKLATEVSGAAAEIAKSMPPIEPFATGAMKVLLRFGKWRDIIALPAETPGPYTSAYRHFARGVAFARAGDVPAARAEQAELETARTALGEDNGFLQNSPKTLGGVAAALLEGRIAEAAGDRDAAIDAFRRAVSAEDALNYNEPADWFSPSREVLGGALLRGAKFAEAEQVFRADLARNPGNPRSLFGLAAALKGQKKSAGATDAAFKRGWKGGALKVEDL